MTTWVVFLRGMNIGGRRITNSDLSEQFMALGATSAVPFLASGNVVLELDGDDGEATVQERIEAGLRAGLDEDVPAFLRTPSELVAIVGAAPWGDDAEGKPQVMLLRQPPPHPAEVESWSTPVDELRVIGRELHWLAKDGISGTQLKLNAVEREIGPTTTRTLQTISRLVPRC